MRSLAGGPTHHPVVSPRHGTHRDCWPFVSVCTAVEGDIVLLCLKYTYDVLGRYLRVPCVYRNQPHLVEDK